MPFPSLSLQLPEWIDSFLSNRPEVYPSTEERMHLVLELARTNVEKGTGGPFAAAVYTMDNHRLLAPGLNLVESANCAILHAEIVAIMLAQKIAGSYDLGGQGFPACELVCTTEPCAMCLGAVCWSGVRRLVCGAREEDARAVGFDEGPKLPSWPAALENRGIEVVRDVCRAEASDDLIRYQKMGGLIYNARQGDQ